MEWLHVLEMGVKFENEQTEVSSSRGPHRKMIPGPRNSSQSPEKRVSKMQKVTSDEPASSKNPASKFREMSKHIYGKFERRKRKYKKKQIENVGWYYEEANDAKIRDLIDVISLMSDNQENEQFYEYIFNTAYMQSKGEQFDEESYEIVQNHISPILLAQGRPILLNQAVKCLLLFESYYKMCAPLLEISYDAYLNLI